MLKGLKVPKGTDEGSGKKSRSLTAFGMTAGGKRERLG
jgi:hypothetical protein